MQIFWYATPAFCAFELFQNLSAPWSEISAEQILNGGVDTNGATNPSQTMIEQA